jgi:hypothetical protein
VWNFISHITGKLRVFENRMLRRIFEPKREKVMGEWRKLDSGELHNMYSSPHFIRQIKSKRMRWAEYVACTGEKIVQGFGGRAQRKETTQKTEA